MSGSDNHDTGLTEPLSVVEDLDPESPGSAKKWRNHELVLGLILLSGVLTWALGTWWHDDTTRNQYDQGQQAVYDRRWDDALADFSAAAGYKDADALAADAARKINERDSQYEVAIAHQKTGPAALVLQSARAVQTIQPGYKDVDMVAMRAEDQVYTDALSGTVVMRTRANPPGLYYRGAGGWHYLRGSDRWSNVLSLTLSDAARKYVVYDVPGPGWTTPLPTSSPTPNPEGIYQIPEGSPDKVGRRLMLATLPDGAGELNFQSLVLNPADYNYYSANEAGVWGIRYKPGSDNSVMLKGSYDWVSLAYQRVGRQGNGQLGSQSTAPVQGTATATVAPAVSGTVTMPGTQGMVADFGHQGDTLLLAAYGPPADNKANSQLYVAKGDGSDARVVFSTTGKLVNALLSPDDRHVLVVHSEAIGDHPGKVLVVATLLTLDGTTPPVTLQKVVAEDFSSISPLAGPFSIAGVFLESGAFKNKLLLAWANDPPVASATVWLLDVSNPDKVLAETSVPHEDMGALAVLEQPDGHTLLLYNMGAIGSSAVNLTMMHAETRSNAATETMTVTASSLGVPVPQSVTTSGNVEVMLNPTLRGTSLIYITETYDKGYFSYNVYSVGLNAARNSQSQGTQPILIFKGSSPVSQLGANDAGGPGIAGPGAYAYRDSKGILHAHLLDAELDVPLEQGVGAIGPINLFENYKTLR